ncbi:hypothetical protein F7R91_04125 [Streptomyces luteolifulvus]|uniref:Uncharacterized protein n=1 Tax=Streptomyces luteolifulvus TaxID=2615112 RepID=A0A6H9V7C1_9ACTN|nr:hypothetical protein [Streptomyces luteolifulvus]KAB1150011.1 hypothetical protein F7R91_04125 [Streptomyces luteolifulvus]
MFIQREGFSDRDRWWFFRLAARACWAYLEAMGTDRPVRATLLRPRTLSEAVAAPSSGAARAQVNGAAPAQAPGAVRPADRAAEGPADRPAERPADRPEEASAAPAHDPTLVLLEEIWSTFERPSEQLARMRANGVRGEAVESVKTRALSFRTDLRREWSTPEAARSRVTQVVGLLRTVADRATDLRGGLQRMWAGQAPTREVDQSRLKLADALDELLTAVRDASMAVRRALEDDPGAAGRRAFDDRA